MLQDLETGLTKVGTQDVSAFEQSPRFQTKLYIPSTLNINLILWHPQLIVDVLKC